MNKQIKLLIESFFDDDLFNQDEYSSEIEINQELIDNKFFEICKNTLCSSGDYHKIIDEDKASGFTTIKEDPNDPSIIYLGLTCTYDTMGIGPRKRKKLNYPLDRFYKYKISFNEDGTISLYIHHFNSKNFCIFNELLIDFIEKNNFYKIDKIIFLNGNSPNLLCDEFRKIYIIPGNNKISDNFINNFPNDVLPHANEEAQVNTSWDNSTFYKTSFSSEKMFFTLIKKLIDFGYIIKDKAGFKYTKDNIDEITEEVLSGKQEEKLNKKEQDELLFLKNKLGQDKKGQDYITKIDKLIDYFNNTLNKKMYFKSINTSRGTDKINLVNTVLNLRKDNNCIVTLDKNNPNYISSEYGYDIDLLRTILYKMFCIIEDETLLSYKVNYNLDDCKNGIEIGYSMWSSGEKYLDINDLPIIIKKAADFYKLYYIIGKAIIQCKDLNENDIEVRNLKNSVDIQRLNKDKNIDMNTFNFDYLTNQLKTLIDKTCKKYKIK